MAAAGWVEPERCKHACEGLALELVRDDFGQIAASQLAQRVDTYCRTSMKRAARPCLRMGKRACIRELQHYILSHLSADLCVSRLAARAGMSERRFARVFVRETGTTPLEFVRTQRVTRAMRLLVQSTHSIAQIAQLWFQRSTDAQAQRGGRSRHNVP